ncbi:hypothetical protein [Actinoplanes sp. NPDC049118]|uniref:hypothetical protein n=1 Tax=Actinoplanes sp. NPDC049118 TaxID=3155769 RepID=UPI0033CCC786
MPDQNLPATKPASELQVGDWVGEEVTGLDRDSAEIVTLYPFVPDDSRARVLIAYVQADTRTPYTTVFYAEDQVRVLTAEEIAAVRERGERAKRIADIRALATFLEGHPEVPMVPSGMRVQVDLHDSEGLRTVRDLGARFGRQPEERLDDRTVVNWSFGGSELAVIAWHLDGRPAEPGTTCEDLSDPDPTGLAYTRADTEDDPTPVSPARVPLHTGAVVDGGQLVDETPPVHLEGAGARTACDLRIIRLPAGQSWTNDHATVTCKACIDRMPF